MITGQKCPYNGFGPISLATPIFEARFREGVVNARERIQDEFDVLLDGTLEDVGQIEQIASEMWQQGWKPDTENINLFPTDFGLILTDVLKTVYGGNLLFRVEEDLSHVSIWWAEQKVEAFPFHKAYKRMLEREGESLEFFGKALNTILIEPVM
jgi:hypothetical protein